MVDKRFEKRKYLKCVRKNSHVQEPILYIEKFIEENKYEYAIIELHLGAREGGPYFCGKILPPNQNFYGKSVINVPDDSNNFILVLGEERWAYIYMKEMYQIFIVKPAEFIRWKFDKDSVINRLKRTMGERYSDVKCI